MLVNELVYLNEFQKIIKSFLKKKKTCEIFFKFFIENASNLLKMYLELIFELVKNNKKHLFCLKRIAPKYNTDKTKILHKIFVKLFLRLA